MTKAQITTDSLDGSAMAAPAQAIREGAAQIVQNAPGVVRGAMQDAEALARNGIDRARQASARMRDQVGRAGEKTVVYIQEEPVKSVLIAAAVGAVGAALVAWMTRSRGDN